MDAKETDGSLYVLSDFLYVAVLLVVRAIIDIGESFKAGISEGL